MGNSLCIFDRKYSLLYTEINSRRKKHESTPRNRITYYSHTYDFRLNAVTLINRSTHLGSYLHTTSSMIYDQVESHVPFNPIEKTGLIQNHERPKRIGTLAIRRHPQNCLFGSYIRQELQVCIVDIVSYRECVDFFQMVSFDIHTTGSVYAICVFLYVLIFKRGKYQ